MSKFGILKTQLLFTLLTWVSKNKERLPWYVFGIIALAAVLVITGLALTALSPYAGEIYRNGFIWVGMTIYVFLAVSGLSCLIALFLWNFGKGVTITTPESMSLLLTAKNWEEPNIAPDILVCSRAGETKEEYAERLESIRKQANDSRMVVAIPFRIPVGFIYAGNSGKEFGREMPPFQTPAWAPEQMIVPLNTYFVNETEEEYRNYLENFAFYWREYSARIKVLKQDNTIEKNNAFRTIILNTLILLFFAVPSFAQSGQAVADAVGTRIREIPRQGDDVSFIFEKKTFNRIGNGKSNYVELLKNVPMFRDCCHGALIAVTNGERIIAKGVSAGDVAADPMRPHHGSAIPPDQVPGFSLPDSLESADIARRFSDSSRKWSQKASEGIKPWWEGIMNAYWDWFWLILIITVGPWIVAKTAAKEGFWDIHRHAKRVVIITTGISVFLFATNLMFLAKWAGWPNWALAIAAVIVCVIGVWAYDRLNPDYTPKPGNHHRFNPNQNNHPQLGP